MITRRAVVWLGCVSLALALSASADDTNPDRVLAPEKGFSLGKAYQVGNIESVNLSNGGLTLKIPLGQLPPGPAGTAGVTLVYNSKYWQDVTATFGTGVTTHRLQASPGGGWRLKYDYELAGLSLETRTSNDICSPGASSLVQLLLLGPDGNEHKMYSKNAPLMPTGCEAGTYRQDDVDDANPQVWYSLDSSFLRLVIQPGSYWPNNNWILYEPNGERVEYVNLAGGGHTVTRYDKNGNSIVWSASTFTDSDGSSRASDTLSDEFGHSITIRHHANSDEIQQAGNGTTLSTFVNYAGLNFSGLMYQNNTGGGTSTQAYFDTTELPDAVTSVQLPARATPAGANYQPIFQFAHEARYRELSQMTLPSGAVTNYTWGLDDSSCVSSGVPAFFTVQINALMAKTLQYTSGGTSNSETTSYYYNGATPATPGSSCLISISSSLVVAPDGGTTRNTYQTATAYYTNSSPRQGLVVQETRPDGSVVGKNWEVNHPAGSWGIENSRSNLYVSWEYETATNSGGTPTLVKTRQFTPDQNGNQLLVQETGWSAWSGSAPASPSVGAQVRTTANTPLYPAPAVGASTSNANLYMQTTAPAVWNLVHETTVTDGTGNLAHDVIYDYDTAGNMTSTQLRDQRPTGTNVLRTTNYGRDARGRVTSVRDPDGVGADYLYNNCSGFALSSVAKTGIDPTSVVYSCAGLPLLTGRTNPNGRVDSFTYDTLGRLTQVDLGTLKRTRYVYDDQSLWTMTREDRVSYGDGAGTVIEYDDQIGRLRKTRVLESINSSDTSAASESTPAVVVDTKYEVSPTRLAVKTSNPYNSSTPATEFGWTVTLKDASGRTCAIESYSSSSEPTPGTCSSPGNHGGRTSYVYSASSDGSITAETISGAPAQTRQRVIDALGNLTKVIEDPSGSSYSTSYLYDPMGRLTRVTQGTQTRTFTYSTAGWLLTATNPESGATAYDYTPGGRFLKKTNANNATTCMGTLSGSTCTANLDAAGRPLAKTYSDSTPAVSYSYQWERVTGVSNSAASVSYDGFDLLDRVTSRTQTVGALTNSSMATYRPGGLQTETHSNGRVITYIPDAVGRVIGLSGVLNGASTSYLTSATYAAHGGMTSATFGDGLTETRTWDYRTQPLSIARGTALALSYAYCPGGAVSCSTNNGNLQSQTIGALNATQSYTYDGLGRLTASSEGSAWSRSYGYDSRGNQWVSAYAGLSPVSFTPQSAANFDAANRVLTMSATYDNAGNQVTIGSYAMAYDAENRMISSTLAGGTTTYKYDGEGRRVQKSTGGVTTTFVYDVQGRLATEYSTGNSGNGLSCTTCYLAGDHLGSTRLITAAGTGQVVKRIDYLPFGEIIPAGLSARTTNLGYEAAEDATAPSTRFTSQYRDAETQSSASSGLDYFGARYFSAAQGRFTSADPYMPSADVKDPQNWNRYSHARNNPLRYVDANGLAWSDLSEEQRRVFAQYANNYNSANKSKLSTEEVYNALDESQMATYESVTYAMERTSVEGGGNALQLVSGVTMIAGEVSGASGDKQFRLYANLKPGAIDQISKTEGFEFSSNKKLGFIQIYHKGFPDSYRQTSLPSLQPSYSKGDILRDALRADIDIDYEPHTSPAHLRPANSDVRAPGHYQKYIDKWPGLRNWWDK